MRTTDAEPRLLIPQLKPFYEAIRPLSWTLVRLSAGLILLSFGWKWVTGGFAPAVALMNKFAVVPAEPMAAVVVMNETLGAICVALGLFTRFFAASITIQMAALAYIWYPNNNPFPSRAFLLWCLVTLAIWLRGGGPWSLDRLIGKEL